jgi:hypothetical protein
MCQQKREEDNMYPKAYTYKVFLKIYAGMAVAMFLFGFIGSFVALV